jgi:hypothetical protein
MVLNVGYNKMIDAYSHADYTEYLYAWLDDIKKYISSTEWGGSLKFYGVDAIDCMYLNIYYELNSYLRNKKPLSLENKRSRLRMHIPGFIIQRRLPEIAQFLRANILSSSIRPVRVVFWPCEPTHVKTHLPVYHYYKSNNIESQFVVSKVSIYELLRNAGIQAIFAAGVWRKQMRQASRTGQSVINHLSINKEIEFPYNNTDSNFNPVSILIRTISNQLSEVLQALEVVRNISCYIRPSVLVVGNDLTLEGRTACLWAKRNQLRTISLMHGSISGFPFHRNHVADRFLVYGSDSYDELMGLGLEPE